MEDAGGKAMGLDEIIQQDRWRSKDLKDRVFQYLESIKDKRKKKKNSKRDWEGMVRKEETQGSEVISVNGRK